MTNLKSDSGCTVEEWPRSTAFLCALWNAQSAQRNAVDSCLKNLARKGLTNCASSSEPTKTKENRHFSKMQRNHINGSLGSFFFINFPGTMKYTKVFCTKSHFQCKKWQT